MTITAARPTTRFSGMLDAHARVTGRVDYTINQARLLRSSSPHARIARLDVTRARRVPGVALVLTGEDVLRRTDIQPTFGPVVRDQPLLAIGTVRFIGEPVV